MRAHSENKRRFYEKTGKRWVDLTASFAGLLLLSPLLIVLALLVKLSSPGPVLYRQKRVGQAGKCFSIAKFRSMYADADKNGLSITSTRDPRITPIGRTLRRLKLDELPQLWNVLRGDMSLVGPRPEVPSYVESYSPIQRQVLLLRPGITDPASIIYREEENLLGSQLDPERYYREIVLPDKLRLNLDYLRRLSFSYDLSLIARTVGCLFATNW